MLVASRLNVESSLRVRMLEIREREFDFFMNNVRSVGRLTTVLAGFGHAGLLYTKFIDHNLCGERELLCAELLYPLTTALALGCAITAVWGSVLLATMAPGAALHGHHDHYSEIVDKLEREFSIVLRLGALSVGAFGLVGILYFWAKWGQAIHHSDPARVAASHTHGGGLGASSHHWASSFQHGEHINAVRDLPTAVFLTFAIIGFLYIMYLVQQYLSNRVFYISRKHIVRGTWRGRGHAAPDTMMHRMKQNEIAAATALFKSSQRNEGGGTKGGMALSPHAPTTPSFSNLHTFWSTTLGGVMHNLEQRHRQEYLKVHRLGAEASHDPEEKARPTGAAIHRRSVRSSTSSYAGSDASENDHIGAAITPALPQFFRSMGQSISAAFAPIGVAPNGSREPSASAVSPAPRLAAPSGAEVARWRIVQAGDRPELF